MVPENTYTIAAGSKELYEVVKSEDGLKVTIRYAQNPEKKIELDAGAVPELIGALQKLGPYR
jgi:hypothetical protein